MKKRKNYGILALVLTNIMLMCTVVFLVFSLKAEFVDGKNNDTQQSEQQTSEKTIDEETASRQETVSESVTESTEPVENTTVASEESIEPKGDFVADWQGKKVAWYGDSLTELYYHCDIVNEYFDFEGYNCGIRGANVAYYDEKSLCLSSRMTMPGLEIPADVEVIFIMAGTNDWCNNTPLGDNRLTYDADGNLRVDNTTFYGGCHEMFNNLTLMYPNAYILVMGAPFGASNTYNIYNNLDLTIFDYGNALCEVASMWGIPSFNIGEMMGVNVNNVEDSKALMYEGIHFVEGGARMAADVIIEELASRKNYK